MWQWVPRPVVHLFLCELHAVMVAPLASRVLLEARDELVVDAPTHCLSALGVGRAERVGEAVVPRARVGFHGQLEVALELHEVVHAVALHPPLLNGAQLDAQILHLATRLVQVIAQRDDEL